MMPVNNFKLLSVTFHKVGPPSRGGVQSRGKKVKSGHPSRLLVQALNRGPSQRRCSGPRGMMTMNSYPGPIWAQGPLTPRASFRGRLAAAAISLHNPSLQATSCMCQDYTTLFYGMYLFSTYNGKTISFGEKSDKLLERNLNSSPLFFYM